MTLNLTGAVWRKSTRSSGNGNCVEVGVLPGVVAVRDTKDRQGGVLTFDPAGWSGFVGAVKAGEFDR